MTAAIVVIAKSPVAGRCKTRLCPPCRPEEAAAIAEASLADTLAAVGQTPARRRVLALDGPIGPWLPAGFEVIGQRGGGLDERLENAFADVGQPALVIGMDTPQVGPALLHAALRMLGRPGNAAVLGPAHDGGFWALGLRASYPWVCTGVPMSTDSTASEQLRRLENLQLRAALLPSMRDVDLLADAIAVARDVPGSCFANAVARVAFRGADSVQMSA